MLYALEIRHDRRQCVHAALIVAILAVIKSVRRKQGKPTAAAAEIPILAAFKVVEKRLIVRLHNNAYVSNAGVGHRR